MRIYTYIFITIIVMGLLHLGGIDTTSGVVIDALGFVNPEDMGATLFYITISGILLLAAGGMYLGIVYKFNPESYIVAPLASLVLIFFGFDILSIIVYYKANYPDFMWMGWTLSLILFPVGVSYLLSLISWWRGLSD